MPNYQVGVGLGCDFSLGLLRVCRRVKMEVAAADSLWLPYRTSAFDAVLSIAVSCSVLHSRVLL